MNLTGERDVPFYSESVTLTGSGYDDTQTLFNPITGQTVTDDYSDSGSWEAVGAPAVDAPDASSSAVLLGMALIGLGGLRRFRS